MDTPIWGRPRATKILQAIIRGHIPPAGGSALGSTQTSTATPAWAKPIATLTWLELLSSCSGPSHLWGCLVRETGNYQLTKINATLYYILIILKFIILRFSNFQILRILNLKFKKFQNVEISNFSCVTKRYLFYKKNLVL